MDVFQQMYCHPEEHQIAIRLLLTERLGHSRLWPKLFRQSVSHIRQRISGTAGHNEFTLGEEFLRLVPLGYVVKSIDANQKKRRSIFFRLCFSRRTVSML